MERNNLIILTFAAIIIIITSIKSLSFALFQFKNKNIFGGILVSFLSIFAVMLILYNII